MKTEGARRSKNIIDLTRPPEQLTEEQLARRIQHRFDVMEKSSSPSPSLAPKLPPIVPKMKPKRF